MDRSRLVISAVMVLAALILGAGPAPASGAAPEAGSGGSAPAPAKKFQFTRDMTYADEGEEWKTLQSQVGRKAPALNADEWLNGTLKPGDAKEKIVVIDFWATWCGPCKAAVPHTNAVASAYAAKGVTVIGVCNKDGSDKMGSVVKSTGMKFPTARDKTGRIADSFGVQWWPYYVVVDRAGIVRAVGVRPDRLEAVLDGLLEEQPPKSEGQSSSR